MGRSDWVKFSFFFAMIWVLVISGAVGVMGYYKETLGVEASARRASQFFRAYATAGQDADAQRLTAGMLCKETALYLANGYEKNPDTGTLAKDGTPGAQYLATHWKDSDAIGRAEWEKTSVDLETVALVTEQAFPLHDVTPIRAEVVLHFTGESFWHKAESDSWCIYSAYVDIDHGLSLSPVP